MVERQGAPAPISGGSQCAPEVETSTSSDTNSTISKAPTRMKCGGNGAAPAVVYA